MDINKEMLEQKNQELALQLVSASVDERPDLLDKLNMLSSIQRTYETICAKFESMFPVNPVSVDIEVTDGALSENYFNLKKALSAGMVDAGRSIRISFPGLQLEDCIDYVKDNGFLHNRSIARRFYEAADIRNNGRKIRFTRVAPGEYIIEAVLHASRRPPFQFSLCHIGVGETIAYVDNPSITCTVYDDRHVLYQNQIFSLSTLAQKLRDTTVALQGPLFFTYRGEVLDELRKRLEDNH